MQDKCPCKDCICVPVCSNKTYDQLISDCKFLLALLYKTGIIGPANRRSSFIRNIKKIRKYLNPTSWETVTQTNGFMVISHTSQNDSVVNVQGDLCDD